MGWDWFYNRIQTTRNLNQPNSPQTPYCYRHSFGSAVGGLFWTSKGWVQIPPKVGFKSLALNVFFSFFPTSESPGRSFSGFKPGLLFFFWSGFWYDLFASFLWVQYYFPFFPVDISPFCFFWKNIFSPRSFFFVQQWFEPRLLSGFPFILWASAWLNSYSFGPLVPGTYCRFFYFYMGFI